MLSAYPPVTITQLADGSFKATAWLTEQDRARNYRDVSRFYIRAQWDLHDNPQRTDAKLCWWAYLQEESMLTHFTMPLFDSDDYLICQYATETPRSKRVRFNSMRTRLPKVQVQTYSGGDHDSPRHFYLYWDMTMALQTVIDGMQEDWNGY
jgi:hypothetical protein